MAIKKQMLEVVLPSVLTKGKSETRVLEVGEDETPGSIINRLDMDTDIVNSVIADGSFISISTPLGGVKRLVFLPHLGGG